MLFKTLPPSIVKWPLFWSRYVLSCLENILEAFKEFLGALLILALFILYGAADFFAAPLQAWMLSVLLAANTYLFLRGFRVLKLPSAHQVLKRLEEDNKLHPYALQGRIERLPESAPAAMRRLWREYKKREKPVSRTLSSGRFINRLMMADRFGLGFAGVLLLLIGGLIYSFSAQVYQAFHFPLPGLALAGPPPQVELVMPDYIGPVKIPLNVKNPEYIRDIPLHSRIRIENTAGDEKISLYLNHRRLPLEKDGTSLTATLTKTGAKDVRLFVGWRQVASWPVEIVADEAPRIQMTSVPEKTAKSSIAINYEIADDFGVSEVNLVLDYNGEIMAIPLALPKSIVQEGTYSGYAEVAQMPFAGEEADIYLLATDKKGQEGSSQILHIAVPARQFENPVSRTLIDLRRQLFREGGDFRPQAANEVQALERSPDLPKSPAVHLGMRVLGQRLALDEGNRYQDQSLDLMWDLATHIEDGRVTLVEKQLRALEEEIMEALKAGADPQTLAFLMEKYKRLLALYLQQQADGLPIEDQMATNPFAYSVGADDLMEFINYLQQLAASGQYQDFSKMFSQLRDMMQNLQTQPQMSEKARQIMDWMKTMQGIIRRQDELLNQTFVASQHEEGPDATLTQQQRQLVTDIKGAGETWAELLHQLAPGELRAAEELAEGAATSLRRGDAEGASKAQSQVVANLQKLLKNFAQQASQMAGFGGQRLRLPGTQMLDDGSIQIPNTAAPTDVQKMIRNVRQRLSDPSLPDVERRYYQHLLDFF